MTGCEPAALDANQGRQSVQVGVPDRGPAHPRGCPTRTAKPGPDAQGVRLESGCTVLPRAARGREKSRCHLRGARLAAPLLVGTPIPCAEARVNRSTAPARPGTGGSTEAGNHALDSASATRKRRRAACGGQSCCRLKLLFETGPSHAAAAWGFRRFCRVLPGPFPKITRVVLGVYGGKCLGVFRFETEQPGQLDQAPRHVSAADLKFSEGAGAEKPWFNAD